MTSRNVQKAAEHYITKMGMTVIPCRVANDTHTGKEPISRDKKWDKTRDPTIFDESKNIGVVLGKESDGLKDIDLDCPQARIIAEYVLPETNLISGREYGGELTASHFYYRTEKEAGTTKFVGGAGTMLELRGDGGYTILPPSVVRKGEDTSEVQWLNAGEPAFVDHDDLLMRCKLVAVGCDVAQQLVKGSYHDVMLRLSGGLAHAKVPFELAVQLVRGIVKASGQDGEADRLISLRDTYAKHAEGKKVEGLPSLRKFSVDASRIAEWLGTSSAQSESVSWSFPEPVTSISELRNMKSTPRELVAGYLWADFSVLGGTGGTGKTTIAMVEAINYALSRPIWGREVMSDGRVLFVTKEDTRDQIYARLLKLCEAMHLSEDEILTVTSKVFVSDVTLENLRLTQVKGEIVAPTEFARVIANECKDQGVDIIIFDPMVSFGIGESRVNDAEQGLVEAARLIFRTVDCCVRYIHHVNKASGSEKSVTQFSLRGGGSLADGARMVAVMARYRYGIEDKEWLNKTSYNLMPDEVGLHISFAKNTYGQDIPDLHLVRRGWEFVQLASLTRESKTQALEVVSSELLMNDVKAVLSFIQNSNIPLTQNDVKDAYELIGLKKNRVNTCMTYCKQQSLITDFGVVIKNNRSHAGVGLSEAGLLLVAPWELDNQLAINDQKEANSVQFATQEGRL